MIIKASAYKNQYVAKAKVAYILKDKDRSEALIDDLTLLHNFTQADPKKLHLDMNANAKFLKQRKNGSKLYHFIISFSPQDSPYITKRMLMDITTKFIELRGLQDNIVLGKAHIEDKHKHIHILASSNAIRGKRPTRFSKKQFRKLLRDMEAYQLQKYPQELSNSVVHLNKPERTKDNYIKRDQNKRREAEFQRELRTKGQTKSQKQKAKEELHLLLSKSQSFEQFIDHLNNQKDFELYSYRHQIRGIIYGKKKYRFSTLNVDISRVKELQKMQERLAQLSLIRETFKGRDLGRHR